MKSASSIVVALGVLAAACTQHRPAEAHCRTTASPVDPSFRGACWDRGAPLFWRNACVSFNLQKDAGAGLSYAQVNPLLESAFDAWSSATCAGGGNPSIKVVDLGPVDCDKTFYDASTPNQHVVLFREEAWPYPGGAGTLALTTVSFDPKTGELFDVDMEINAFHHKPVLDGATDSRGFDLASVLLHESGHFLGLSHSSVREAAMYSSYVGTKRALAPDDAAGICAAYPANGTRVVSTEASPSGIIQADACDGTPRHGFSAQCDGGSDSSGCDCRATGRGEAENAGAAGAVALLATLCAFGGRRRRATLGD